MEVLELQHRHIEVHEGHLSGRVFIAMGKGVDGQTDGKTESSAFLTRGETKQLHTWLGQYLWEHDEQQRNKRIEG